MFSSVEFADNQSVCLFLLSLLTTSLRVSFSVEFADNRSVCLFLLSLLTTSW